MRGTLRPPARPPARPRVAELRIVTSVNPMEAVEEGQSVKRHLRFVLGATMNRPRGPGSG
jgi:hypothetical protein